MYSFVVIRYLFNLIRFFSLFSRLSRNWLTSSTFSLVRTKAMRITNTCSAQCKWKKKHFFVKRMWAKNHEAHNILGKVNGGLLSETLDLFSLSSKIEIKGNVEFWVWFLSKTKISNFKSLTKNRFRNSFNVILMTKLKSKWDKSQLEYQQQHYAFDYNVSKS